MDRNIREGRSELSTKVYDVHEYKDMMEEYVCKRYKKRRGEGNGLRHRKRKLAAAQRGAKRNGTASLAVVF